MAEHFPMGAYGAFPPYGAFSMPNMGNMPNMPNMSGNTGMPGAMYMTPGAPNTMPMGVGSAAGLMPTPNYGAAPATKKKSVKKQTTKEKSEEFATSRLQSLHFFT